jgi:hypothetical protein
MEPDLYFLRLDRRMRVYTSLVLQPADYPPSLDDICIFMAVDSYQCPAMEIGEILTETHYRAEFNTCITDSSGTLYYVNAPSHRRYNIRLFPTAQSSGHTSTVRYLSCDQILVGRLEGPEDHIYFPGIRSNRLQHIDRLRSFVMDPGVCFVYRTREHGPHPDEHK